MSDILPDPERTEQLDEIGVRFEAAWKQALRGGAPPALESYLTEVPADERDAVRQRLTSLDTEYRRLTDPAAGDSATLPTPQDAAAAPATQIGPRQGSATAWDGGGQLTTDAHGSAPPSTGAWPKVPGYKIESELGRGGMGVVYKARQIDLQRTVALKMILAGAHASAAQLERFKAEARAEARLQHPNIVQVYEIGEHDALPYFSLEFVDGGNLSQKAAGKPQPPRDAARLIEILARAAHYAHERGIVHRDLKPANVLLASPGRESGESPIPKIADFGLAKCLDDESGSTRTGLVIGTPSYMAPEQALGQNRDITRATDVYALGAILYELLTARPPFLAATMLDTVEQVRTEEPVPPTRLQPKLPRDLETICLKCLHKDARKRYAGADALADDLHRFLAGEPIQARPVGSVERLWRWCRRNPRVAGLSAAVALLLVASTVGALAFAYLIDRKQREAEQARATAEENAEQAKAESARADASAREAVARYALALDALNVVVGKVGNQLENTPATERVRTEVLQAVMKVLEKSAAQGDPKGLAQRALASAHMALGNLLWEMAKREDAVKEYDTCHRILTELYQRQPDSDKAAGNFAMSLCKQADMDADFRQDLPAAQARYREALTIQEDLLAHPRDNPELTPTEIKATIANSYQRLGEIAERLGPAAGDDAEGLFEKALKLREEVAAAEPTAGAKKELGHVHYLLGEAQWKRHQEAEAEKHYEAAASPVRRGSARGPQQRSLQDRAVHAVRQRRGQDLPEGRDRSGTTVLCGGHRPRRTARRRRWPHRGPSHPGPRLLLFCPSRTWKIAPFGLVLPERRFHHDPTASSLFRT